MVSLSPEDCQNSRSLCRFYSRSLVVVTSVKSKLFRGQAAAASSSSSSSVSSSSSSSSATSSSAWRLFRKVVAMPTVNAQGPSSEGPVSLKGVGGGVLEHMARKRPVPEKDFYPTGGPRGFSAACAPSRSGSSYGSSGRKLGKKCPGDLLEQYTEIWRNAGTRPRVN